MTAHIRYLLKLCYYDLDFVELFILAAYKVQLIKYYQISLYCCKLKWYCSISSCYYHIINIEPKHILIVYMIIVINKLQCFFIFICLFIPFIEKITLLLDYTYINLYLQINFRRHPSACLILLAKTNRFQSLKRKVFSIKHKSSL